MQYLTKALHKSADLAVPMTSVKTKSAPYNPVIATRIKQAYHIFCESVSKGKPSLPHPVANARKMAKRRLRAAQIQQVAIDRAKDIENASLHCRN